MWCHNSALSIPRINQLHSLVTATIPYFNHQLSPLTFLKMQFSFASAATILALCSSALAVHWDLNVWYTSSGNNRRPSYVAGERRTTSCRTRMSNPSYSQTRTLLNTFADSFPNVSWHESYYVGSEWSFRALFI